MYVGKTFESCWDKLKYTCIEVNTYPTNPPITLYRLKDLVADTPYFEVTLPVLESEYKEV